MASPTRRSPLPGRPVGRSWEEYRAAFVSAASRNPALSAEGAGRLADTYGVAAERLVALVAERPELGTVVDEDSGAIAAEIIFVTTQEGAHTLEDVLLRRTAIGLNADVGISAAPVVAELLVAEGTWSPERAQSELAAYLRAVIRFAPKPISH